jgi:gamma-glutamyltranspeptidase/glutathione hydrolase
LATQAGYEVLKKGGSAIDAAIAVQMVLTLVEPQSSGIGGGAFLLYFDHETEQAYAYDGRETAPAAVDEKLFLDKDGKPRDFFEAHVGGLAVGVPGVLKMLKLAHEKHGKLAWQSLFESAIDLSKNGFKISPRLHRFIKEAKADLKLFPNSQDYFFKNDGSAKEAGTVLKNQKLAQTFREIATTGIDVFYLGSVAKDMVAAVQHAPKNPGFLSLKDLENYQPKIREPLCSFFREHTLCGMPPPSSGGIAVLQIFGILENFNFSSEKFMSLRALHYFIEASKLAFADRNLYVADADFVKVPVEDLIDKKYLKNRASLIEKNKSLGVAQPGIITPQVSEWISQKPDDVPATSHISVVDAEGNAVSMTTSVEYFFGSKMMVDGFMLNNQLTDFSFVPEENGKKIANRVEPGKRPRSSMAPFLVFDVKTREFIMAIGSPGGSRIIDYVARALFGILDFHLGVQDVMKYPNVINMNGPTELEEGFEWSHLKAQLEGMGHEVKVAPIESGLHGIYKSENGYCGGADPRREGVVLGE